MNKTLEECYEEYKFYSSKCCDAITNHEKEMEDIYTDKLFALVEYALLAFNVDLNDADPSNIF